MSRSRSSHNRLGRIEQIGNDARLVAIFVRENPEAKLNGFRIQHGELCATKNSPDRGYAVCDCIPTILMQNGRRYPNV